MTFENEITAKDVRVGDSLPDLDNAYIVEVNEHANNEIAWIGHHMAALDGDLMLITFHDAEGNENYLILRETHPLRVQR